MQGGVNIKYDKPIDPRDPVLDAARVLELTRRHLPAAQAVTAVDETGNQARAYVVDDSYIFKTQRPHKKTLRDLSPEATWPVVSYADLEKEYVLFQHIEAAAPDLKAPRALGYGREEDVEYLLMTRIPGVRMGETAVEGPARLRLLHDLGAQLRRLHGVPIEPLRQSGLFPGDREPADIPRRIERLLHDALAAAASEPIDWDLGISLETVATRIMDAIYRTPMDEPVPLHSNPSQDHVFVDPKSLQLTGLIDFGDAYFSHPAIDVRRWRTAEDRHAVLDGYASLGWLSDSFLTNWRTVLIFLQIHEMVFRPAVREEALAALRTLIAEW